MMFRDKEHLLIMTGAVPITQKPHMHFLKQYIGNLEKSEPLPALLAERAAKALVDSNLQR